MNSADLLQAIRERATTNRTSDEIAKGLQPFPPATEDSVRRVEIKLGFSLPPFLKAIYAKVGNGGFGPGYGVLGLPGGFTSDGDDLISLYDSLNQQDESDSEWKWPTYYLPICDWGCAIRTCVDAFSVSGTVFSFDPNGREIGQPMDEMFAKTHENIESWFMDWINEVALWDVMFEKDESRTQTITNPFTGKQTQYTPSRLRRSEDN